MAHWYDIINQKTDHILEGIKDHDFIKELVDGSLSKEVFLFYIKQDALYLAEYKKVLAIAGVKCLKEEETRFFLDSATGIIHVENELHQLFLKDELDTTEPSPTCELYNSYLSRMVNNYSVEIGLAAILPCFTIYKQIGDYILGNQTNKGDSPYQNWIDTYGGEEFAESTRQAIAIVNRYAQNASPEVVREMNSAFEKASKLEWMFWDSAYKQEQWPV